MKTDERTLQRRPKRRRIGGNLNEELSVRVVGLDIGGANLKACSRIGGELVRTAAFALWKQPDRLAAELANLLAPMPPYDVLAVTMTAELCDCFETKRSGVDAVLDAVKATADGRSVLVWQTNGQFVDLEAARGTWMQTAAANWLALATYAGRFARQGRGLLIDVGSTTTDVVALFDGVPVPQGRTDPERLASGELLYRGVRRTPVCALLREVPWRGRSCAVAAEWFATTLDVYLVLGDLEENEHDRNTADGRPATRCRAYERLARVICSDREMLTRDDVSAIAETLAAAQMHECGGALERVVDRLGGVPETVVVAGEGAFLARRLIEAAWRATPKPTIVSLAEKLGDAASQAACAYAVAALAQERLGGQREARDFSQRSARVRDDEHHAPIQSTVVVKVGGSLLDLDDLPERLRDFLRRRPREQHLLVVGGGRPADAVRALDSRCRLGDDTAHWLAVRAMGFNARLVEALLAEARVVADPRAAQRCWIEGNLPILDPWEMLHRAEPHTDAATAGPGFVLPHSWDVTGDSIAAWVATRLRARELVLLKSASIKPSASLEDAGRLGLVDGCFARAAAAVPMVTYVNLRSVGSSAITLEHRLPARPVG